MKKLLENRFVKKSLIGLGILVLLIFILDFIILPLYVSESEVSVPNVVGMTDDEALTTLEAEGF